MQVLNYGSKKKKNLDGKLEWKYLESVPTSYLTRTFFHTSILNVCQVSSYLLPRLPRMWEQEMALGGGPDNSIELLNTRYEMGIKYQGINMKA